MPRRRPSPEALGLGPLEAEVMRILWRRGPSLGADVEKELNRRRSEPLAYTTVVNVLSNLETKGVVEHVAEGRRHRFAPTLREEQLLQRRARGRARELFSSFSTAAVSAIVEEIRATPEIEMQFRRLLDTGDEDRA